MPSGGAVLAEGDIMLVELRLAALNGEHLDSADHSPHLKAASMACSRFRNTNCEREPMRKMASKFAEQRQR